MRSEGSSYIFSQSPSAERLAGLTIILIRLSHQSAELETEIIYTGWTGKEIEDKDRQAIEWIANVAVEGAKEYAADHNIDLSRFKLRLCRFIYHVLDTKADDVKRAGRNAFASAWAAMAHKEL